LNGRLIIAGGAFATAIILLIIAPVGSHILAHAAHKSRSVERSPVHDALEEDEK